MTRPTFSIAVVKIGGSVLTGRSAYRRAAAVIGQRLIETPGERLVIVVSAEFGTTDALLETARNIVDDPDPGTLDLLWSTGEIRSAALLAFWLHASGIRAAAANVHQTGLTHNGDFRPLRLQALLATHDVVVAPGFLARGEGDAVVSLGRGGSDLTAVLLAAGLGAVRCELVKDVPGYFSADPNVDPNAQHLPSVSFATALAMADAGCELVQRQALAAAQARTLPLVVRALDGRACTLVTDHVETSVETIPVERPAAAIAQFANSPIHQFTN
jgi:aspartate kinase